MIVEGKGHARVQGEAMQQLGREEAFIVPADESGAGKRRRSSGERARKSGSESHVSPLRGGKCIRWDYK